MNSKSFLLVLSFALLTSCTKLLPEAAKIDIPQGNKLEQKQIDQLKVGLTKDQVNYLLGYSIMTPNTKSDVWEYLYYNIKAGEQPKNIRLLTVYFNKGVVSSFKQTTRK